MLVGYSNELHASGTKVSDDKLALQAQAYNQRGLVL